MSITYEEYKKLRQTPWDDLSKEDQKKRHYPREIKVAHYWFNGDTGRQIAWVAPKPYTDYSQVEFG